MPLELDYSPYIREFSHSIQLTFYSAWVYVFFRIWKMTYCISRGHDLLGRLTFLILVIGLFLMAFGPERVTLVRILVYGSMAGWGTYNIWYFNKYPIPKEYLRAKGRPNLPTLPIYVPKLALFRYLADEGPQQKPFWFSRTFASICLMLAFLFCMAYGFSRTINAYAWGLRKVAEERKLSDRQTKQAVSSAVGSATNEFIQIVDSVAKAQAGQLARASQKGQSSRDSLKRLIVSTARTVQQARRKASAAASRPQFYVAPVSTPKEIKTTPDLRDRIKAPESPRKGKRVSVTDEQLDSTYLAKTYLTHDQ